MEIRTARPEDAEAVSNVLTASYAVLLQNDYDPETLVPALSFMGKAQPDLLASGTFYLAHIGGRLAACGGWTANAPGGGNGGKPDVGHIRHFATHPDMVRRGASGAILTRCIDEARAAGFSSLQAMSTRTAVPFYKAHGFQVIGYRDVEFPGGVNFPSVAMLLQL